MHSVRADLQVCAGGHAHQLAKVLVQLQLDLLLVFTLVSVLNGLDRMHAHNEMYAIESITCDQQHYSPYLLYASYWDGSITCTRVVSSSVNVAPPITPVSAATHSVTYANHVLP